MKPVLKTWIGAAAWLAFVVARNPRPADDGWTHALLVFAALVLAPLALEIFAGDGETMEMSGRFLLAQRVQLPAALMLATACLLPAGTMAGLLALPWLGVTGFLAWVGLHRMRRGGLRRSMAGLCADVALMYGLVGGIWTLADRVGSTPLGFDRPIVALTAVHFHYAGWLLPLFAGLVCREMWMSRLASRAAVGVVLGVPMVALGITFTQLGWGATIEAAAGCGLALAGMAVAILQVRFALDSSEATRARVLLAIAGISLFLGMTFAALYAVRAFTVPISGLGLPQMRLVHGSLNAIGFGLCGVLGWRLVKQK
jgi:hypothetical protein